MKVATVTPVYNSPFLKPFLKQISVFDENIILLGEQPFEDYLKAGFVSEDKGNTEEILAEFPKLHIYKHNIKFYSGELFNLGLDIAKSLNCEVVVKIDPDMFLTKEHLDILLDRARNLSEDAVLLDMASYTTVYEKDFDHGVTQSLWHVGGEPFVIKTSARFIEDGTNISIEGAEAFNWPIHIHHFSGFKRNIISEVEKLPNFPGWKPCPQEIRDKFQEE